MKTNKTIVSELKKQLKSVATKMTIMTIPENALLHGVVKHLEGREAFNDADCSLDEKVYNGDVFEAIAGELAQFEDSDFCKPSQKVIDQLDALAELVSTDYVLITKA